MYVYKVTTYRRSNTILSYAHIYLYCWHSILWVIYFGGCSVTTLCWIKQWLQTTKVSSDAHTAYFWQLITICSDPSNHLLLVIIDHHLILHWDVLWKKKHNTQRNLFRLRSMGLSKTKGVQFRTLHWELTSNDIRILQPHFGAVKNSHANIALRLKEHIC